MSALKSRIDALKERLVAATTALNVPEMKARCVGLEADMNEPAFWQGQNRARRISQEAAEVKREVAAWESVEKDVNELAGIEAISESENDSDVLRDAEKQLDALEKRFAGMEFAMLFSGGYDSRNAIVSLHAGAGGTDALDWTAMLLRMYTRFAERHGFTVDVLDESPGEEAGFKSVTIAVRGRFAYGWLRSEAGVHRLVRISPFDAEKMRHTTFALAEVLPEFDDVDAASVALNPDDIRIDTFMSGGKGGQSVNTTYSAVRVTHIPTGISVSCQNERSQSQNKDTALGILKAKLLRLMQEERAEKLSDIKGEHKTAAWGNQIRSYVLHPYKLVKDHRTETETADTDAVLDGEIDEFVEAYLRKEIGDRKEYA